MPPVHSEEWRHEQAMIQAERELKECTFQPNRNKTQSASTAVFVPKTVVAADETTPEMTQLAAAERLYSKRKPQAQKTDKAREDYEFERQEQECTFQPKMVAKSASKKAHVSEITICAHQPGVIKREDDPEIQAQ